MRPAGAGEIELLASGDSETFRSNFLAVPPATPPRSVARATLNQRVPSHDGTISARWSRAFGGAHFITAGADWRRVTGESQEDALDAATGMRVTLHRTSGGREQTSGLYVQDMFAPSAAVVITAGARIDRWSTDEGHNVEMLPSGAPTAANSPSLPDRSGTLASPRLAALVRVHPGVQVWGGAGAGFRAPTLNELYRQFRVGATLTLPNADLGAERLAGYEGGVTITASSRATLRATLFDNHLRGPISNVTISTSPSSVVQQRQNLGRTRTSGVELDAEYTVQGRWTLAASYVYTHAIVTDNPAAPDLVGNVLPQVPANRGSARAMYTHPRMGSLAISLRFAGAQYDDDRNTPERQLPAYAVIDVQGTRPVHERIDLFLSAQNLLNQTYWTGTLPTTIGLPRLVSAGVRVRLGGR
jgi:outer membrane receptor protein involved in Fe transport